MFVNRIFGRAQKSGGALLLHTSKMPIKAALIDLSGTLHIENEATPNAVEALHKLRQSGIALKFVTNTTKESRKTLYERLRSIGFELEMNEIYSSLTAAANFVVKNKLNPLYFLTEDARRDFPAGDDTKDLDSVIMGLAPEDFNYEKMNKAFNLLISSKNPRLIAINQSKYYKRSDGLALGTGCFVKGLEYSARIQAELIGKPNSYFFKSAIPEGVNVEECVMIGDDPSDDVAGAMKVGLKGILVKTGKYLPSVVVEPPPTALVDDFSKAVDWLLEGNC